MNKKVYNNLYNAIITLVICLLGASYGYGQIKLNISYINQLTIAFIICTIFIVLKILGYKLLYILIPISSVIVVLSFSGIKTFPEYAEQFYRWFMAYGRIDSAYNLSFSIIFAILLCVIMCTFAQLLSHFYKLQILTGALLFIGYIGLLINDLFMFKRSIIFVFIYFIIILIEFAYMHKNDKSFENAKKKVVNTFPSIAIIFLVLLAVPVKKEPINLNIIGSLQNVFDTFTDLTGLGSTKFNMAFSGYSEDAFLKGNIIKRDKTVMTIDVAGSTLTNIYLIGDIYDTFDGREWTVSTSMESDYNLDYYETIYALSRYNPKDYSDIIHSSTLDITFENFHTDTFFYPLKTRYINNGDYILNTSESNIKFEKTQNDGTNYNLTYYQINLDNPYTYDFIASQMGYHYTVDGELSDDTEAIIAKKYKNNTLDFNDLETLLFFHSRNVYEAYTDIPELSKPIIEYIEAITSGYDNDIDKLKAIEYTLSQYTYTTKPSITPSDHDFLERFLLESKEGYCTYYATAFTLMARYLGYPARYVQGFCVPAISNNSIEVSSKNAHAWCEVYFEGVGWIPFEPTPSYSKSRYTPWAITPESSGENNGNSDTDNENHENTDSETAESAEEDTTNAESMPAANSGEHYNIDTDEIAPLPTYTPKTNSKYRDLIITVVIIISILMIPVIFFIALKYLIKRATKKYNTLDNRQKVIHNMNNILYLLKKHDISLNDAETLSEFYTRVKDDSVEYAPFLSKAVPLFEEIRYGNKDVDNDTVNLYEVWQNQLLESCESKLGKIAYIILCYRINL